MSESTAKKVYLETFGCQMNVLDSELVAGSLRGLGYAFTDVREGADVVLFNTCSVRQAAEDKVHGRLGDMKAIKRERPDVVIGVIGCMAEREGAGLLEQYKCIDLMCGPSELDKVPMLIDNAMKTRTAQTALTGHTSRRSSTLDAARDDLEMLDMSRSFAPDTSGNTSGGSAYVRITRGCNKFCTYCVVPMTRGAEVHRAPDAIVEECRMLAEAGMIEVTLLGQTVNHYRFDHGAAVSANGVAKPQVGPGGGAFKNVNDKHNVGRKVTSFADLLKRIHDEVPAIRRLRFVTSYPRDFGNDILQVMADSPRICRYFHLPAQHGSDRILKLMNREYITTQYVHLIDRIRDYMPDAMIASDFIVGFPTETDADFERSAKLLRRCRFKNSFIFKYSPRPGTTAIDRLPDDVPEEVKKHRNVQLLAVQAEVSQAISDQQIGKTLDVMVEGASKYEKKRAMVGATEGGEGSNVELGWASPESSTESVIQLTGRSAGDLIVMFDGSPDLVGCIVPVKVHTAKPLTLFGDLV